MSMTTLHPDATGPRMVEIAPEHHGQRIDNFLLRILKGVPKSRIYRILRRGEVRVNRGRVKPDYRLQTGDQLRIPPIRLEPDKPISEPPRAVIERIAQSILLENTDLLVLNKPAGLAVHGGSGLDYGLIEVLRRQRDDLPFLELAHRLDRETSGCLVLAKSGPALRQVQDIIRSREADKRYLTLVRGDWQHGSIRVSRPLTKNTLRGGERMVVVDPHGKSAVSHFKLVQSFGEASLLEVVIETGRTHQIRVHAADFGHPIAGDDKYGDSDFNRQMAGYGLKRLFLHAHSLMLPLPGRELMVSAPLGDDLSDILTRLEQL